MEQSEGAAGSSFYSLICTGTVLLQHVLFALGECVKGELFPAVRGGISPPQSISQLFNHNGSQFSR